jgi:hypothetical protein
MHKLLFTLLLLISLQFEASSQNITPSHPSTNSNQRMIRLQETIKSATANKEQRAIDNKAIDADWDKLIEIQNANARKISNSAQQDYAKERQRLDAALAANTIRAQEYAQGQKAALITLDKATQERQPFLNLVQVYEYRKLTKNRFTAFPVRHRQHTPLFFATPSNTRSAEFLAKSLSVINPNTGKLSLYNELYGDYVGWWRLAFGTTLVGSNQGNASTPEEELEETALQRLVGGGGNGLVSAAFPMASFHTQDDVIAFTLTLQPRLATDLPQAESPSNSFAFHSNVGIDLTGYYTGFNGLITPFLYARFSRLWGNDTFYQNLGRENETSISLNQLSVGLSITDVLQIAGTYYYGSSFIEKNFPFSISLTLQPKVIITD